jgi:uncharacterized protein YyaL (SSP411 family)
LDYALLAEGLILLYEATFQARWLNLADKLVATMISQFWDESQGCFYDTGDKHENLISRPKYIYDNALPSGSAAAVNVLLRMARFADNNEHERIAAAAIRPVQQFISKYPSGFGQWLCALDFYLSRPKEIAIIGQPDEESTKALMEVINRRYLPNKVLAGKIPNHDTDIADIPLLRDRGTVNNKPTVYVCEGNICQSPVTEPEALAALLDVK